MRKRYDTLKIRTNAKISLNLKMEGALEVQPFLQIGHFTLQYLHR